MASPRSGARAVNLESELRVQSATSLLARMEPSNPEPEECRWRLMLHGTCQSRAFRDPLGEKAGIPFSPCQK